MPGPPPAAVAKPQPQAEPSLRTKEDIMKLIAEEDMRAKSAKSSAEATQALKQKKAAWREKHQGKGGDKGGGKGQGKSGGDQGQPAAAKQKGAKAPNSSKRPAVPNSAPAISSDGSWLKLGKKARK